jgi:cytochrome P450
MLIANTLPWLTARKAWKGRRRATHAILKYFQDGGQNQGSELTNARLKISTECGFTLEEYSKLEVGTLIGLVSNTIPAMFWCLFDLYYRQKLLDEIREEIEANALIIATDGTYRINLTAIREQCPLLLSTFQEILRTRSNSSPTRLVLKDTLLAEKYLLKAGNTVSIVSELVAQRSEVWGETSRVFNERRFMNSGEKKESRRLGGFLTFGLSPTICPGRHFASSEILLLVAMVILRYDISPVGGVWKEPKIAASLVSIMGPIKEKFLVKASARKEYASIKWGFHVEEGKGQFPLVIG